MEFRVTSLEGSEQKVTLKDETFCFTKYGPEMICFGGGLSSDMDEVASKGVSPIVQ